MPDAPVSIIFTGLLRDKDMFLRSLDGFRSLPGVQEIILSTWEKEAEDNLEFLTKIVGQYDLTLAAVPEPQSWSGNMLSQMMSLQIGLRRVPDRALTLLYLLHPDPWPKNKHAKRRMMNDGPVRMFADKLKPGGEFRFGTDHAVYLRHALMVMRRFGDAFEWIVDGPASWQNRPSGWPETRYEHKARTVYGHEVWYFRFRRR